ncbi:Flp family type IVb pilin [Paenarthrobacter sp. TA1.8]|uniref:Flp family type IVb pilin n=1 Tax=Paenarthrobacter sp. TA1.8 TaxID=3400219 RepID=UPI003B43A914
MSKRLSRIVLGLNAEDGATATEYSILAGFMAAVIVAGARLLGLAVGGYFNDLTNGVKAALGLP